MSPFTPNRDDGRSLREVAYDYLMRQIEQGSLRPGNIIRHEDLASEMDTHYPSSSYFQAISKVTKMLQQNSHLSLIPIRGTGYRLIDGMAMVDKGRTEHRRARRQIGKAVATVSAVDEGVLENAVDRDLLTRVRRGFAIVAAVVDQQAEQLAAHDEEIKVLKTARMDDRSRIAAVEAQIARLAEKVD